ncbi:hypothetical protein LCM4579_18715 [Ensifer sp. LCM 4579]|nr:hypothetical protein LCM4579_18715 [Ensifer sp. LCM 4579]
MPKRYSLMLSNMFSDIPFTEHIKCDSSLQRSMRRRRSIERDARVAGLAAVRGVRIGQADIPDRPCQAE